MGQTCQCPQLLIVGKMIVDLLNVIGYYYNYFYYKIVHNIQKCYRVRSFFGIYMASDTFSVSHHSYFAWLKCHKSFLQDVVYRVFSGMYLCHSSRVFISALKFCTSNAESAKICTFSRCVSNGLTPTSKSERI